MGLLVAHQGCYERPVLWSCEGHCAGSQIPSVLVGTPVQVMLLHLVRNLVAEDRSKVLTPVVQPVANHPEWPGLQPRVVLAHRANPNHWFTFVCVRGVWWRADSALAVIRQEDPFQGQLDPSRSRRGYTIDLIIFKQ